jgi:biotin operon repressor
MFSTMKHEKIVTDPKTDELKEVNNNFVQFYKDSLDFVIEATRENPTALRVFFWIVQHMDNRNALVVSQQTLADTLDLGRTTIHLCTVYLKEKNALTVFKSGNTNVYALNAQIVWQDSAEAKRYAHFDAKVYISEKEQEEDKPLFSTQLIGHAIKKEPKNKRRAQPA